MDELLLKQLSVNPIEYIPQPISKSKAQYIHRKLHIVML